MGKPTRSTKNEPLGLKYLLLYFSNLEVFTIDITSGLTSKFLNFDGVLQSRYRDFLQNPSQFPGMYVCCMFLDECLNV